MGGGAVSGRGERQLRAVLRERGARRRAAEAAGRVPLDLRPTTPFEQLILAEYEALRREFEELKKRVDWLTLAIVGAALGLVLERVFGG
jgi:hypothetical protein